MDVKVVDVMVREYHITVVVSTLREKFDHLVGVFTIHRGGVIYENDFVNVLEFGFENDIYNI